VGDDRAGGVAREPGADLVGWLELFFDLVVVVCTAVIAERLHEHPDWGGVGVFVVCFTAIWSIWISFVVYTDLAHENTRIATLMVAAGVIGIMAAALGNLDERANAFAVGFVVCRVVAARAASRTGRLLTSWPAVQLGGLTTPWIVSLWVEAPWKYWIWAAALALELVFAAARAAEGDAAGALIERLNARMRRRARGREQLAPFVPVSGRAEHLGDRLGTFVIIVLGEGVAQVIRGATAAEWGNGFAVAAVASFAILVGLWWLAFRHGFGAGGEPPFSLRTLMLMHLAMTAGVVALAAALGELLLDVHEPASAFYRWLPAGGLAVWFVVSAAMAEGGGDRRTAVRALGSVAIAAVAAAAGGSIDALWFVVLLLVAVVWTAAPPWPGRGPGPATAR
jgi:low temperature requirement protein LtrA